MASLFPAVDSTTLRFPQAVRAQLADEMSDPSTEVGAKLIATFASLVAPSGVGARTGRFDLAHSVYLPIGASLDAVRSVVSSGASGTAFKRVAWCGTSIITGYGATPGVTSPPVYLRTLLDRKYGNLGSGLAPTNNMIPGDPDDARYTYDPTKWTYTGGASGSGNVWLHKQAAPSGGPIVFQSVASGTIVEIYTFTNSGKFSYSIDDATAVQVTPSGGTPALQVVTITGLTNTTHKVSIIPSGTTNVYFLGVNVRPQFGLEVAGLGIYGCYTADWLPTATGGASWSPYNVAIGYDPDAVILQLGANEAIHDVGYVTLKTNLTTIASAIKTEGVPLLLVVDPPIESTAVTNWATDFRSAIYDVADALALPLLDLTDAWRSRTAAAALGFYYDQWHPTPPGAVSIAESLMSAIRR